MAIAETEIKVGDRVVYPNQGVCQVIGLTEMEIGGQRETFFKLSREDDQATVMVPKGRLEKVGVRRIADLSELKKVFAYLASPVEGPELDWKVRHRSHGERMSLGGLMGLAQVVKGLTTLADLRPLPPKERELYNNARHLLVSEIAAAASISEVSAEDAVDLALFPPGQERKKPDLAALALAAGEGEGDELDLGEGMDLGAGVEEAEEPQEAEGAEAEAEEGEVEAEEAPPAKAKKPAAKAEKPPKEKPAKAAAPKKKAEKPAAKAAKPKAKPEKKAAAKPKPAKSKGKK